MEGRIDRRTDGRTDWVSHKDALAHKNTTPLLLMPTSGSKNIQSTDRPTILTIQRSLVTTKTVQSISDLMRTKKRKKVEWLRKMYGMGLLQPKQEVST